MGCQCHLLLCSVDGKENGTWNFISDDDWYLFFDDCDESTGECTLNCEYAALENYAEIMTDRH